MTQDNDTALVFAARYFYLTDKEKQARKCLDKVLANDRKNVEALTLFGWVNLDSGILQQERRQYCT